MTDVSGLMWKFNMVGHLKKMAIKCVWGNSNVKKISIMAQLIWSFGETLRMVGILV